MKLQILTIIAFTTMLFSGCSLSNFSITKEEKKEQPIIVTDNVIPYDDVVNMGQYAEAWIAPYKDDDGILYNDRRINFWIIEPTFNNGISVDTKKVKEENRGFRIKNTKIDDLIKPKNKEAIAKSNNENELIELNSNIEKYLKDK